MKVLLTGANGYIGRRLKNILKNQKDVELRIFVRNKKSLSKEILEHFEIFEGDTFDKDALKKALCGVDTAYYLIHSLNKENYKELDKLSAQNFIDIADECGVKRVIYLGGLGVKNSDTSKHLLSRIETGEVLSSSKNVQTIWVRAGVIIGSGSASFEIIRNLVEKLPFMITPRWVDTYAQPIAVDDVINYLVSSLHLEYDKNLIVDIGSSKMSYRDMMLHTATALGLKRYLIPVPFMSINLSSYWLNLFTPVPFSVAKALIEGLKSEVTIQNDNAKIYFADIIPISYIDAVRKAVQEIQQHQVISRWSDAEGSSWDDIHTKEINDAIFVDRKESDISSYDKDKIFKAIKSIGGENGWFDYDFLWEIRGIVDKALGGAGLNRGRRDDCDLRLGECLDFWRVEDIKEGERLLLFAQMKVPGSAWLEFKIDGDKLIQSAYFYPKGIWGRIYWYIFIPMHYLIFNNMIKSILKNSLKI
ncbi:MAG: epimerase [Sulfurimonas sp. RIFOXYD12_FULL_33_39]|uniref:SDR family oxidoreductase n=1 Tax=unclassified Sulfurimonas TaxID=2623549 RepID=UPI0008BA2ECB|nr:MULTISPECIES: SDR family oxidoreductase [unclassified Sulfurimonas]OHE04629.1 MAG: epimerase [Sulfurimonas sp. RIFCSPLOWO2_12_FULL_34_6]OHE09451.1 MAG: epimerase [Sulfurimonas sp. RIFOXYD12_FULL_33_39]OHE12767.1 MAG: epimerase [Sulfurimonas sp. RIFOXYD2_FULL_34_21]DAB27518.1 MAG TPA: epimerase [Sulfurimonas sp. UBA10385]